MQRHQHHKFILNQPEKICTSIQSHWKDKSYINNCHVYDKIQFKTETSEKDTKTRNGQFTTEQFAMWTQLPVPWRRKKIKFSSWGSVLHINAKLQESNWRNLQFQGGNCLFTPNLLDFYWNEMKPIWSLYIIWTKYICHKQYHFILSINY